MATDVRTPPARADSSPEWMIAAALPGPPRRQRAVVIALVVMVAFLCLAVSQFAGPTDGTLLGPYTLGDRSARWAGGAPVERVQGDTPLRPGDLVTAIDGRSVASLDAYHGPARQPGDVVQYTVTRGDERIELDVTLRRFDPVAALLASIWVFVVPLVLLAVAAFVCARRPHERSAQLMLAVGVLLLIGTSAWPLGLRAIDFGGGRGAWPYVGAEVANCLMWAVFLHFALVFPQPPRAILRRPWLPVGCYVLPFALYLAGRALVPAVPGSPLARLEHASLVSAWAAQVIPPLLVIAFVFRYRATRDPADRRRLRYVVGSLVSALVLYALLGQVPDALFGAPLFGWDVLQLVFVLCPLAIAAAILRAQLFDIQVIARRSLIFGLLTGGLLAVSVGVLAGLSQVFSEGSPVFALIAGCAVALCFHPLRRRLQRWVGGLVFGARADPYQIVSELGRLDPGANPRAALQHTVETLASTLRLSFVAVELAPGPSSSFRPAAATGRFQSGAPISIPLGSPGRLSGRLLLEVMPGREPFGRADRQLLEDVASQVGRLTDLALLNAALQDSRARIISAREEERRRLHRDLHDGIGPSLAAQAMQLDVARVLLAAEPEHADEVLAAVGDQTKAIIADLRRVVDDLRPQALDQLGLASGLRERFRSLPVDIDVVTPEPLPELPAAVEVAAYRVAIEAVENARRTGGRSCRVDIRVVEDELALTVRDDGRGLTTGSRDAGLSAMRERAEELGGRFGAQNLAGGGMLIRTVIPLAPLRDAATA